MGRTSRMRVLVLLSLVACAAAYSSGSKTPTPAPTPAAAKTEHRISAAIKLTGVTLATFDEKSKAGKAARKAFKNTVAAQLSVCGTDGKSKCTGDDVVIVSVKAAR